MRTARHGERAERSGDCTRRLRRYLVAALAALALLLAAQGGVAYAYFAATAKGSGAAAVGAPVDLSVEAAAGTATIYPGTSGAVTFTVTNPNAFAVDVRMLTAATVSGSSAATCPVADLTVTATPPLAIPAFTVPPKETSGTESLSGLVQLATDAPSACQGAMFTVHLELSAVTAP